MTERVQPTAEQLKQQLAQADRLQVTGQWQEARQAYTDIIESPLFEGGIRTDSLLGRGVVNRMLCQYSDANRDFLEAGEGARYLDDPQRELIAIVGHIDLARTGDRDPNWLGKSLGVARMYRGVAEAIIKRMPPEWSRAKAEAYINFGLLDLECGNPQEALANYEKAEEGCRQLLILDPSNTRSLNRLARTLHVKGVVLDRLDRGDDANEAQLDSYAIYLEIGDRRGIGNVTRSIAGIHEKSGNIQIAAIWYQKALNAAVKDGNVIDKTVYDDATAALKRLAVK